MHLFDQIFNIVSDKISKDDFYSKTLEFKSWVAETVSLIHPLYLTNTFYLSVVKFHWVQGNKMFCTQSVKFMEFSESYESVSQVSYMKHIPWSCFANILFGSVYRRSSIQICCLQRDPKNFSRSLWKNGTIKNYHRYIHGPFRENEIVEKTIPCYKLTNVRHCLILAPFAGRVFFSCGEISDKGTLTSECTGETFMSFFHFPHIVYLCACLYISNVFQYFFLNTEMFVTGMILWPKVGQSCWSKLTQNKQNPTESIVT